ncbi:MAG TPA: thioredoxin domain-containing protein [Gemmatimonadaceae bacterium]|nr:thioredoxin domain-containing protein [Gemmatimonadaceae bacterium]
MQPIPSSRQYPVRVHALLAPRQARTRRPRGVALRQLFAAVALGLLATACGTAEAEPERTGATAAAQPDSAHAALLARADLGRIMGAESAPVWLVVISDFQCPYCKVWHDETQPLVERDFVRTGKVRLAYLNFPSSSHRNAWPAHEAAMCAAEQDAFWPLSEAIFATQGDWKTRVNAAAFFDSLAGTLPLDRPRLRSCIADGALRATIRADYERSVRIGIGSTPSFLVQSAAGTRALIGAQPYAAFKGALDQALSEVAAGNHSPAN